MENHTFKETQVFSKHWILIIQTMGLLLSVYALIDLYIKGEWSIYNVPVILVVIFTMVVLFFAKLILVFDEDAIHIKYFPFHLAFVSYKKEDIQSISLEKYDPLSDFGGWGIKYNYLKKREIFFTSGNDALVIKLNNGKERWIGVQNKAGASDFLNTYYRDKLDI